MLNPLVWNPFDEIAGLPLHPLVVHFAVVLLPLGALGLIALVAVPRWADRFAWPTLGALAGGTVAAFVAKTSGEALAARMGEPATHAAWGDRLPFLAVALLMVAGVWFVLRRRGRGSGRGRTPGEIAAGLAATVLALGVTAVTVLVGHTGAQAAWGDLAPAAVGEASATPSPPVTPDQGGRPTTSPSSAGAPSYTMAEVAKHATASSCWTAINGKVYDVTRWISRHPGGQRAILSLCGTDGSAAFNGQHGGQSRPAAELAGFRIGSLR